MFFVNIKRIIKNGFSNFWRNGVVSISAILVMVITLFIISSVLFTGAIVGHTLNSLKNSVDVNVSILPTVPEDKITAFKTELENLPQVESVEFISKEQALENYKERHKDDPKLLAVVEELRENPLSATLNIRAKEIGQYDAIQKFIEEKYPTNNLDSIVEEVNYAKKKEVISKLSLITNAGEQFGFFITIIFIILSILITLNTIRLTIFISKEEINIMNLVGADKTYISGPFMVTGSIYGIVASVLVLILLYPITLFIGPKISNAFFDFSLFSYYVQNFGQFFLIIFFAGIFIGSVSSLIAVNRYLKF